MKNIKSIERGELGEKYIMKILTEAEEQKNFVKYLEIVGAFYFFIPNERAISQSKNPWATLQHFKSMGLKGGVPDLFFPRGQYRENQIKYLGLFIEMKSTAKTAHLTKKQKAMHQRLTESGYCVLTAYGCIAAIECYEEYINPEI